ncbi:hemophore-related protein [Nocardia sp. NEAU-G5]|uniref:Hemophore-related protein n=1 Tax=Nocardia albiluteola TaxID=2842303 RepID=A0ABS6ATC6_9NOCA|nr:hemophore-related protein [Nocardia albiluteola]MBU3061287.1 hemophore-related protein [Nocardia albiluteola]
MTTLRSRLAGTVAAAGGLAVAAALLFPGVAAADPTDLMAPLLNSTCSFDQVDRALHAKDPQLAQMLDANPSQKAMLKQQFDQPPAQRKAEVQQYLAQHPEAKQQAQNSPQAGSMQQTIQAVADSCHNY